MTSQRAGITFRFCEAAIIVGESVRESNGSTRSPASGWTSRARASASSTLFGGSPVSASSSAEVSGPSERSGR